MYVTGREGSGSGTILSSLAQTSRDLPIKGVTILGTNPENVQHVQEAKERINGLLGARLHVDYINISGDPEVDIPRVCGEHTYDCGIVSVPDHLHFSYTRELLKARLHCLVVKPFTPTLAEALELTRLQQAQGLHGVVEFHKRFDQSNLYVKKQLQQELLGKLLYFTVDYSQKLSIPLETFKNWSGKTNIFQYLGVHYVDLIYFLTGYRPFRCLAIGMPGILRQKGIDTWDSVHAQILWSSPEDKSKCFLSQFTTNWIDPNCTSAMSDQKYKVIGTRGRIECDQKNRGVELVHETLGVNQINPYFSDYLPAQDGSMTFCGYGHDSIHQFLVDVSNLKKHKIQASELVMKRPGFSQSLVSTAVVDAINQSLAEGSEWKDIEHVEV
jgi:predicted dehydrogenase